LSALSETDQEPNPTKETLSPFFKVSPTFFKNDSKANLADALVIPRSEERRVGKECRSRWLADHEKKKQKGHVVDHVFGSIAAGQQSSGTDSDNVTNPHVWSYGSVQSERSRTKDVP